MIGVTVLSVNWDGDGKGKLQCSEIDLYGHTSSTVGVKVALCEDIQHGHCLKVCLVRRHYAFMNLCCRYVEESYNTRMIMREKEEIISMLRVINQQYAPNSPKIVSVDKK